MRRVLGGALIGLGCALLIAAAGFLLVNMNTQQKAHQSAQAALVELMGQVKVPQQSEAPTGQPLADYLIDPRIEMPVREVDGVPYIGYLTIPALELELPVISETTYPYLKKAPCRFAGSAYLDDLVVGAHNYSRHFGAIDELSYGAVIHFTDMDGNVFSYTVESVEILQPYQGEELCSGEWPLTLYTCTIGGRTRVVVRCDRVE